MEDVLFSTGGADRLLLTLKYFRERPAMREVEAVKELSTAGVPDDSNKIYYTKAEKMMRIVTNNIKGFIQFFSRPKGENDKGGGRRLNEDQNAYDSAMTSMMSNDLTRAKLGRVFAREMGGSYRAQKRAQGMRTDIEDMDNKQ